MGSKHSPTDFLKWLQTSPNEDNRWDDEYLGSKYCFILRTLLVGLATRKERFQDLGPCPDSKIL